MTYKGIDVYDSLPDGWAVLDGAINAPFGYVFVWNRKSRFGKEFKHGLISVEQYKKEAADD